MDVYGGVSSVNLTLGRNVANYYQFNYGTVAELLGLLAITIFSLE